jgi:hypothetical protein
MSPSLIPPVAESAQIKLLFSTPSKRSRSTCRTAVECGHGLLIGQWLDSAASSTRSSTWRSSSGPAPAVRVRLSVGGHSPLQRFSDR